MSIQTVQQRRALRYAAIKHLGDLEVAIQRDLSADALSRQRRLDHRLRANRDRLAAERLRNGGSSTPTLQRCLESGAGVVLMLIVGLAVLGLAACGEWRARPDLKVSTLTQSSAACVRGHKTEQVGTMGVYGTPVVVVTAEPCEVKP